MNARGATKVFFGCPTAKQEIAQAIIDELRNRKAPIEPVRWWDSAPQGVILHKIMEQLSSCAFSVIGFSDGEEKIRNNCIFEAGIVAGMSELDMTVVS